MTALLVHSLFQSLAHPPGSLSPCDGLKVGSLSEPVRGIAVTWMATREMVLLAARRRLNLIISHEPFFYDPLDHFKSSERDEAFIEKMQEILKNHLLAYRLHDLWLDFPCQGITDSWAHLLGLDTPMAAATGLKVFPASGQDLGSLAARVKSLMNLPRIEVLGNPKSTPSRIALLCGPPADIPRLRECIQRAAGCVITGESSELALRFAQESGLSVLLTGHAKAETPGVRSLADFLRTKFPEIPIEFLDLSDALKTI